jgi:hypothetical protein
VFVDSTEVIENKNTPEDSGLPDGMRRSVSTGCDTLPIIGVFEAQEKGDRLMKKISAVAMHRNKIFNEPKLTIGLNLGDRTSHYGILD